jgi:exopolyphosphatase/guanosine-5'-triphosphate,3'-diphosphate pyrophosphatase
MTPPPPSPGALIGAGGTITTAAAILQGLTRYEPQRIHGSRLSREAVIALIESLARLPLAERERVPGLEEKRADIIVAGLIILQAIMEFYGAQELTVSDEGILHGAVMESIQP